MKEESGRKERKWVRGKKENRNDEERNKEMEGKRMEGKGRGGRTTDIKI